MESNEYLDETEYLLSSKANKERLESAIKEMGNKEPIIQPKDIEAIITPVSLLSLGFTEEYQKPECGDAGYLYYSLYVHGVALLSTSLDDDDGFYVFMDDNTKVTDYNKLERLVTSLREL